MESTTLTDRIQKTIVVLYWNAKDDIKNQDCLNEIYQFINVIGSILVDPNIKTDKELANKMLSIEVQNYLSNIIAQSEKIIGIDYTKELFKNFHPSVIQYDCVKERNRFVNQVSSELLVKKPGEKNSESFMKMYRLGGGSNIIFMSVKRILSARQNKDGKIFIGKDQKDFLSSKYSKKRVIKFPSNSRLTSRARLDETLKSINLYIPILEWWDIIIEFISMNFMPEKMNF